MVKCTVRRLIHLLIEFLSDLEVDSDLTLANLDREPQIFKKLFNGQ